MRNLEPHAVAGTLRTLGGLPIEEERLRVEAKLNFRDSRKVPPRQKEQARPSLYRPSPEVLPEIQKKLRFRANGGVTNPGVKPMLPVGEP